MYFWVLLYASVNVPDIDSFCWKKAGLLLDEAEADSAEAL